MKFIIACTLAALLVADIEAAPHEHATSTETSAVTYSSSENGKPLLKGITLEVDPFLRMTRNRKAGESPFEGYLVDVLNAVTKETPFGYSLHLDSAAGKNTHNDLIGQVRDKNFDFALADLTITDERKKSVDFSAPLLNITLTAVVRKMDHAMTKTLKELVEATSTEPTVKYGIIKGGATEEYLSKSENPLAKKIWAKVNEDKANGLHITHRDAYRKVREGNFIFFGETPRNFDYIAARECDLKSLMDTDGQLADYQGRQQALVVRKDLAELTDLNKAIKKLTDDGTLAKLQEKYWKDLVACRIPVQSTAEAGKALL